MSVCLILWRNFTLCIEVYRSRWHRTRRAVQCMTCAAVCADYTSAVACQAVSDTWAPRLSCPGTSPRSWTAAPSSPGPLYTAMSPGDQTMHALDFTLQNMPITGWASNHTMVLLAAASAGLRWVLLILQHLVHSRNRPTAMEWEKENSSLFW